MPVFKNKKFLIEALSWIFWPVKNLEESVSIKKYKM